MEPVQFVIPGKLIGKGRPRAFINRGKLIVTTPQKTRTAEDMVRFFAREAMKGRDPMTGPVSLSIWIHRTHPESWSRKKKTASWVTGKPDLDNCCKLILDSLNRIVFVDDAQVAELRARRRYTSDNERTLILIQPLT